MLYETLKCPQIAFVHYLFGIFNSNPQFLKKLQPVLRPQSSIVPPCNISFEGTVDGTSL
jgi:hypothetical protein